MSNEQREALDRLLAESGSLEWRTIQLLEDAETFGDRVILERLKAARELFEAIQDDTIVLQRLASVKHRRK